MALYVPKLPANKQTIFRTARPTSLKVKAVEITLNARGAICYNDFNAQVAIQEKKWTHLTICIDTSNGKLSCYINAKPALELNPGLGIGDLLRADGPFSLDLTEGLVV